MNELDTAVIAVSQEDRDLKSFAKMPKRFEGKFPIVADLNREWVPSLDRTTAYLIDKQGIVREVFPMIIHARPSWDVIIAELEKLESDQD
ncbi:MAG: peroxiredoxin [Planctomycetota bacterium]